MTAVGGVYTAMWNVYLNEELEYVSTSPFIDLNDQVFRNWNFNHVDPTGAEKGGPNNLYTAGDLAASMAPCRWPTREYAKTWSRGTAKSGHMVYLDNDSRAEMKKDLANFYESATTHPAGALAAADDAAAVVQSRYHRRFSKTPY